MNHLLERFFHLTKEAAPDGLQQAQREAIIDLLNLCRTCDHHFQPREEYVEAVELKGFTWAGKIPLVVYTANSLQQTETAFPSADARAQLLADISTRLADTEVKTHAVTVAKELFIADGEFSPHEREFYHEIKHALGWPDQ